MAKTCTLTLWSDQWSVRLRYRKGDLTYQTLLAASILYLHVLHQPAVLVCAFSLECLPFLAADELVHAQRHDCAASS